MAQIFTVASEPLASPVVRAPAAAPAASAGRLPAVDPFLTALAKTVQRQRNYAPSNPLCAKAVAASHQALLDLGMDELVVRVTPAALLLADNTRAGESSLVRTELTRRLHRLSVGSLSISGASSPWELSQFCRALVDHPLEGAVETLDDALHRAGIEHVQVTTMTAPAFLEIGAPPEARLHCVHDQQAWRERDIAARGAGGHLYTPNKGWVRVDPACRLESVSLGDLALLADDGLQLASMLVRLSDAPATGAAEDAFEQQLEQISYILRSLNPAFVEPMFGRLAETLLSLDEPRRKHLLSTVLLPGLLDGRLDGALLRQLPDDEIAGGLDAFGDVQVAAPALVVFALDRLALADDRRRRIESLLLGPSPEVPAGADTDVAPGRIGGYADGRIQVEHGDTKRFDEFTSYDVALGPDAAAALETIRARIDTSRREIEQLRCMLNLLRLEANPGAAAPLAAQAAALCGAFQAAGAWKEFAFWTGSFRRLAESVRAERPEVAAQIQSVVSSQATPALIDTLVDLAVDDRGRDCAGLVLEALGPAAAAPAADVLERETSRGRRRVLLALLNARASCLAEGLLPFLTRPQWFVVRNALHVLGHAGPGHESAVAPRTDHPDPRVAREAFRALAQIGTPAALGHVVDALGGPRRTSTLALEALWRFPAATARAGARTFLARTDLVVKRPALACGLLDTLAQSGVGDLQGLLGDLRTLRRRFWSLGALRVGFKAASLARRA